jgi:Domain of unknown function (DUF4375)
MPESIESVLDRDQRGEYASWENFDDALWGVVSGYGDISRIGELPEPVRVYFATRLVEWDVGNGGFAQAAMNYLGVFENAATGFESLGKPDIAALIRAAAKVAESEQANIDEARAGGIEGAFEYFGEGDAFDEFDERLNEVGWFENGEARLSYVRAHRDEFVRFEQSAKP